MLWQCVIARAKWRVEGHGPSLNPPNKHTSLLDRSGHPRITFTHWCGMLGLMCGTSIFLVMSSDFTFLQAAGGQGRGTFFVDRLCVRNENHHAPCVGIVYERCLSATS